MSITFRCRCGRIAGEILDPQDSWHFLCYCRDCRAYAHALGKASEVLDAWGGTHVLAVRPRQLTLTRGQEALACLSLTERGLLRWYAGCCGTALLNTPRNPRLAYAGLVHTCLAESAEALERRFGPVRHQAFTKHATSDPPRIARGSTTALASLVVALLRGRLGGSWRLTPFFDVATGEPVVKPRVLTGEELARARAGAAA
jgi:hypothetical protein